MGSELMPGELHELSVAIGRLQADVKNLAIQVRDNHAESTDEHRAVHNIVAATAESVRVVAADVAEMKPLVEDYREKRAEARGAARLIHTMYAFGGGTVALIGGKLLEMWGGKPPHP